MLINAIDPEESRIAVVEDGVLQELHVELANREAYLGNVYKAKVINIEPSIGAAFVSFGGRVNGFLHVSDVLPAYGRPEFMLDDVIEGRARVNVDDGPESMQQALADDDDEDGGGAPMPAKDGGANATREIAESMEPAHDQVEQVTHADIAPLEIGAEPISHGNGEHGDSFGALPEGGHDEHHEDRPHGHNDDLHDAHEAEHDRDRGEAEVDMQGTDHPTGDEAAAHSEGAGSALSAEQSMVPSAVPVVAQQSRRDREQVRRDRFQNKARRARPTIDQLLRKGQEVVVQITKEGIGTKGPTLTTYVSMPGRCLVVMPSLPKCGVSRKIEDVKERKRLKRIVRELDETGHGGIGFIVRTAGINKTLADLQRDRDYLKKIWEMVAQRLKVTRAPALLYQESDLVLKAMRDLFTPDIAEVVVDSEDVYLRIKDFADKLMPHMSERIRRHELTTPLFHSFGIEKDVEALYQAKIDLPNGASIVIDQTEALVAIDVNSGKFKPGSDLDETAYRTNMDSISEIVRQLRLRDLGGLIIIDFIDMAQEKHRRNIERRLIEALHGDRARIKVGRISPFGMLEITRQRVGPGLKRTVFMQCTHCKGSGWSRTVQSKSLQVLREVRALMNLKGYSVLQVFTAPGVNDYLSNYKRRQILDLEEAVGKTITFRPEMSYPIDVVHYRFLTGDGQEARVAIPAGLDVKA
ncbi:MAG: Rne/Rng family ribonuclease [Planctomycetota bacterium]|nr:Rne/Rng family ribonuclease [Planctomycetota bacterium]